MAGAGVQRAARGYRTPDVHYSISTPTQRCNHCTWSRSWLRDARCSCTTRTGTTDMQCGPASRKTLRISITGLTHRKGIARGHRGLASRGSFTEWHLGRHHGLAPRIGIADRHHEYIVDRHHGPASRIGTTVRYHRKAPRKGVTDRHRGQTTRTGTANWHHGMTSRTGIGKRHQRKGLAVRYDG